MRAGQRLGGGGGVGDSEPVTQSSPSELLQPATLQLLQKGTLEILQVVTHSSRSPQVRRAERGEGDTAGFSGQQATASSAERGRRGRPSRTGTGTGKDKGDQGRDKGSVSVR